MNPQHNGTMGNLIGTGDPNGVVNGQPGWSFYDRSTGDSYINTGEHWGSQWTLQGGGGVDSATLPPIGSIIGFHSALTGTPALSGNWLQCDGQVVNDPESPYNGQTLPNLNLGGFFLRGNAISGTINDVGSEDDVLVVSVGGDTSVRSSFYEPPSMTVVWIIRIK